MNLFKSKIDTKHMNLDQIICKNLISYRKYTGYSKQEIAQYLDISKQEYIRYENGAVEVPMQVIEKLAMFYNVDECDMIEENTNQSEIISSYVVHRNTSINDLKQIAQFQKIVKNYIQMCDELEK